MKYDIGQAVKKLRSRSGLTQIDLAHLMRVDQSRISRIESGHYEPTIGELCTLSIIYDKELGRRSFMNTKDVIPLIKKRLDTMPACPLYWHSKAERMKTLDALSARLDASTDAEHAR